MTMIYYKEYNLQERITKHDFKMRKKSKKEYNILDKQNNGKLYYLELDKVVTLDIETTSYYKGEDGSITTFDFKKDAEFYKKLKGQSIMYIWMMSFDEDVVYGRTTEEMREFLYSLKDRLDEEVDKLQKLKKKPSDSLPINIYVHNLSFEFPYLVNAIGKPSDVFARAERKVMYAEWEEERLKFRCSYILTNKSLANAIDDCLIAPENVRKMVGDLDYYQMRTPLTPLTEAELGYCKNDCLGLYYVIKEKKLKYGRISNIPNTQTGEVRNALKKVLYNEYEYKKQVQGQTPNRVELELLMRAYYGGYTHANYKYANETIKGVISYDISSSYPYVLCTQKYPIKPFSKTTKPLCEIDLDKYSVIADVTLTNIKAKTSNSFLSAHKSLYVDADGEYLVNKNIKSDDNGRLLECDEARYVFTDVDLQILNEAYDFTPYINSIYIAEKDYLPKRLIEFLLDLFQKKTLYKDVPGKESLYKEAKERINCIYGMFVTKTIVDPVFFDGLEWYTEELTNEEIEDRLSKMAENEHQLCAYSTGVWCSAYGRGHLWDVILEIGEDVIYCDTDSVKYINKDKHIKVFEEDNKRVMRDIYNVCIARDIDPSLFTAIAPNGQVCKLGFFEEDGVYHEFRTLGAKKYAYTEKEGGEVKITVSGVNKKAGAKFFKNIEWFRPGIFLDYEYAGKLIMTYVDEQEDTTFPDGYTCTDRKGAVGTPTTYRLNISTDYARLLQVDYTHGSTINTAGNCARLQHL